MDAGLKQIPRRKDGYRIVCTVTIHKHSLAHSVSEMERDRMERKSARRDGVILDGEEGRWEGKLSRWDVDGSVDSTAGMNWTLSFTLSLFPTDPLTHSLTFIVITIR